MSYRRRDKIQGLRYFFIGVRVIKRGSSYLQNFIVTEEFFLWSVI